MVSDLHVDPLPYCLEAQRLFDLYQNCIGRRQAETLLENYVDSMQAVKIARQIRTRGLRSQKNAA